MRDNASSAWIRRFGPPGVIVLLAAAVEIGGESTRLALRYQRDSLADGELWRLITGHLVHLGPSHMLMNVVAVAILAFIFVRFFEPFDWLGVFVVSALAIDGGLYWISTDIAWYVGLSGVLHGVWAAAAIFAWRQSRRDALVFSALIFLKLGYEAWQGPLGPTGAVAAGPVVTVAHAYGAMGGAGWAIVLLAISRRRRSL